MFPAASDVYTTEAGSAAVGPDPSEPGTRPPDRNAPGALAMLDAVSWRTAVELDGVTFRYDAERHPALHDVSLVVPQRGVTAVAHSDGPGPVPV